MIKRSDGNQKEIVEALRRCGVFVFSLHEIGKGCPDLLLCHHRTRSYYLAEIKNGKLGWKLTRSQKKFRALCPAPVLVFTCITDAVTWASNVTRGTRALGESIG